MLGWKTEEKTIKMRTRVFWLTCDRGARSQVAKHLALGKEFAGQAPPLGRS